MASSLPSIADLVTQMQENVNAIHQRLSLLSDTKDHDDEIERLENERLQRLEEFKLQQEKDAQELAEKRQQVADAAAEKRRLEREQIVLKRKQEEEELAATRKREEEELAARRRKEDEERQVKLEQEEEELRIIEQKEEEQWLALQAEEDEKRKLEAEELENGLHDEVDVKMMEKEEEMERRMAEGQRALRELDEKRKAINALIDAQINGTPITPTFRRGSKRYSTSPLAANVAAMLARGEPPNEHSHINEPVRADRPGPKDLPKRGSNEFARRNTIVEEGDVTKSIPPEDTQQNAVTNEVPFPPYEEAPGQGDAHIESEPQTPSDHIAPIQQEVPQEALPRDISLITKDTPVTEGVKAGEQMSTPIEDTRPSVDTMRSSSAAANSRASEDPDDQRAREEMERINAEIMAEMIAAEAAAQQQSSSELEQVTPVIEPQVDDSTGKSLSTASIESNQADGAIPKQTQVEDPEDARAREEMARINAEIMAEALAEEQAAQQAERQSKPELTKQEVFEDPEDVRAREEMARLNAEIMAEALAAKQPQEEDSQAEFTRGVAESEPVAMPHYPVTMHEHLPTWANQADLAVIHGAHGMLNFREGGADMEVISAFEITEVEKEISHAPLPVYDVIQHQLLPTWVNQADLDIVSGAHGMLVFREGGADLTAIETSHQLPEVQKQRSSVTVYNVPQHELLPTWADQSELSVVCGSHGVLIFREGGADLEVVEHPQPDEAMKVDELAKYLRAYQVIQHRLLPTWVNQAKLSMVQGSHGVLAFGDDGADMAVVETPKSAKRASIMRMRERADTHRQSVSKFNVIKHMHLPTWVDQATLSVVRGSHGQISFRNGVADMVVVDAAETRETLPTSKPISQLPGYDVAQHSHLPTWADQASLSLVHGSHGQLVFGDDGADMIVIESPRIVSEKRQQIPTFMEESKLTTYDIVQHKNFPTWADQANLPVVYGAHGQLVFDDNGADMVIVQAPQMISEEPNHVSILVEETITVTYDIIQHEHLPTWADQKELKIVEGAHGVLVFNENGADMEVVSRTGAQDLGSITPKEIPAIVPEAMWFSKPKSAASHPHNLTRLDSVNRITSDMPGGFVVSEDDVTPPAATELPGHIKQVFPITSEPIIQPVIPEEPIESDAGHLPGHFKQQLPISSVSTSVTATTLEDANNEQSPRSVELPSPVVSENKNDNEMPGHMKQRFPFLAKRMAAKQAAESQAPPPATETLPMATDRSASPIVEQTLVVKSVPNGLGSATMNHGVEKRPSPPREISTDNLPSEIVEVAGVVYNLEHPALEELVHTIHDRHSNPYWVDQATLELVKGSHGVLRFTEDGAETDVVQASRASHPYWTANQAKLDILTGSHGLLNFNKSGSHMTPFVTKTKIASQSKTLAPGSFKTKVYWAADQSELQILRGQHGVMHFEEHSQAAFMDIVASKQNQVSREHQWVDQAALEVLRGSHATLAFGIEGAHMVVTQSKSTSKTTVLPKASNNPYWVDQSTLNLVKGSHGVLVFHSNGADLEVLSSPVVVEQSPLKVNQHWVDQSQLEVIRGSHATLTFRDGGADMIVVHVQHADRSSSKAVQSHIQSSNPYWVDQATLENIRGSHGTLVFRDGGADMNAIQVSHTEGPTHKPSKPHSQSSNPYWVDQATLKVVQGTHAMLSFNQAGASLEAIKDILLTQKASFKPSTPSTNPSAYWVDQAKLDIVTGSHGSLSFSNEGASLIAHALPSPKTEIPHANPYWIDQASLNIVRGNHGILSFHANGASLVPHDEPITYFDHESSQEDFDYIPRAVHVDDGARFPVDDFTDVSSQSSFVSYPDSQDEIAQLVARDAYPTTNYREHDYLSDVPELDSELDDQFHESHDALASPAFDAEEWAPRSLDDATMPTSERSVPSHQDKHPDFHHDLRGDSEHALLDGTTEEDDSEDASQNSAQPAPEPSRSSRGLGTFASLANVVKDNVPLVSHIMGNDKGNYSSLGGPQSPLHREPSLHVRTDTADTIPSSDTYGSHDAHSPITPTDSNTSPVHGTQDGVEEPIIRSSWPESTVGHEIEYDSYEPREMKAQASPRPTQTEFDPFNPQFYATNLKSPSSIKSFHSSRADLSEDQAHASPTRDEFQLDPRSQYRAARETSPTSLQSRLPLLNTERAQRSEFMPTPARSSIGSRPTSQEFRPSRDASPSRPLARRGTVSERVNSLNGGQASPSNNIFQKTRALFESASSPTALPTTRPVSGTFHVARSKRSSLQQSEMAPDGELLTPRSLDSNPKPPSPGFHIPTEEREDEFYKPAGRKPNTFYGALSSVANGLSSSIHNPANPPEKARLLGSGN